MTTTEGLGELRAGLIVEATDPGWDAARQAWNLAVDQRPAAVALVRDADDVIAAVGFARRSGWRVAAQSTGHNMSPIHSLDATLLVNTAAMTAVTIDVAERRARVGGGAVWGDVAAAAAEHGLAPLAGSSPDVGVVGYTLGGGLSWLGRRFGLAANSVHAIEIVTPDGIVRRVDEHSEPDLFWALRGGGGNFGVITAMEFDLYPAGTVFSGQLFWPIDRARDVIEAWVEWSSGLAPETSGCVRLLRLPPLPIVPEPLRGGEFVVVEVAHLGDADEGESVVAALRALGPAMDTLAAAGPLELLDLHMDPTEPVPAAGSGCLLSGLPPEAIEALLGAVGPGVATALLSVEIRLLGAEIARPAPSGGAVSSFGAPYVMHAVGLAPPPAVPAVEADVDRLLGAMSAWAPDQLYLNFAERAVAPESLWPSPVLDRLRAVADRYDPDAMMRANHPIRR